MGGVVKGFIAHGKWLKIEISEDQKFQATLHYSTLSYFGYLGPLRSAMNSTHGGIFPRLNHWSQWYALISGSRISIFFTPLQSCHCSHVPEQKEEANHPERPQLEAFILSCKMAVKTSLSTSRVAFAGEILGHKNEQRSSGERIGHSQSNQW